MRGNAKKIPNIRKRGNKWAYVVYVVDPKTGKKKQEWHSGYDTQKQAVDALNKATAQVALGQYTRTCSQTVEEYLNEWFASHRTKIRPATARGYEVNLRVHIIPAIGHLRLDKLVRRDVQKMCDGMSAAGKSVSTVKYAHRVLSMALELAVFDELIAKNPCLRVEFAQNKNPFKPQPLNIVQSRTLIDSLAHSTYGLEYLIGLTLGCRRGEILGLKFSDFNFEARTVHIQRQYTVVRSSKESPNKITEFGLTDVKTAKSDRIIGVPPSVIEAVKRRSHEAKLNKLRYGAKYNDQNLVCCDEYGNPINPHTFYTHFKNLLRALGLPSIRLHDLRSTNTTLLIEGGVNEKLVQDELGHSNGYMTRHYCGNNEGSRIVADSMEKLLFSRLEQN